jgi:hypothetical protein
MLSISNAGTFFEVDDLLIVTITISLAIFTLSMIRTPDSRLYLIVPTQSVTF